jgi:hypothetical protein
VSAVARHLKWPEGKVQAAVNYAEAFPEEIDAAMACCLRPPNSFPRKRRKTKMLKLLLDEHISPEVANGLRRRNRAIEVR